jgi:NRPS condensation-like uncharacterized protein
MRGRLNVFQQSMLQWNELHPYNAVHVVHLAGTLELERLKTAVNYVLEAKGLTGLTLDLRAGTFEYQGGAARVEIKVISSRVVPSVTEIAEEIGDQLNAAFPRDQRFSPFRFFVASGTDSFALGLVYFHAVADAESILFLLKSIVERYFGGNPSDPGGLVEGYGRGPEEFLPRYPGVLARKLGKLPRLISELRRTYRPHYRDVTDFSNRFVLFSLEGESLSRMAQLAKGWGVTLNDLFLALLMQSLSCLYPERARAPRRRGITLGCVVNTRRDIELTNRGAFGVFLGHFVVHHEVPEGITLESLAKDIARQTLAIKRGRLYLGAALELALGRWMMGLFPAHRRKKLYLKHYPLWGGLSNMDLNPLWGAPERVRAVDYFRAVSTGPVTPLVLSITSLGAVANIGVTYRPTVFSASDIARIQDCFLNLIGHSMANL